jgi:hypothetical protein
MRWKNVSLSKLIKTKEKLNLTVLDGKIRTILFKLNNQKETYSTCVQWKKDYIYVDTEIVKGKLCSTALDRETGYFLSRYNKNNKR